MAKTKLPILNKELGVDWNNPNAKKGILNSVIEDPTNSFDYNDAPCEKVFQGQDNTYIVFGRDRPNGLDSGYGGLGHLRAGAIDIVVGRLSSFDARTIPKGDRTDSNYTADAARIVLSQKTDVDKNFKIPAGKLSSRAQSAVAIKADAVRIIARESLKLVTNADAKLSNGENCFHVTGVQLIAKTPQGNIDMQPIPKGRNVILAFENVLDRILELNGILLDFMNFQKKFNMEVANHTHMTLFYGTKTSTDPAVQMEHFNTVQNFFTNTETRLGLNTANISAWATRFAISTSPDYINSNFHHLN